jgi:hypothetical protein
MATDLHVNRAEGVWYNSSTDEWAYTSISDPVISPTSGEYPSIQLITITTLTGGASIYYTVDGSDPDDTSTLYTAPFTLTSAETIKAITKLGAVYSNITTETYTITAGTYVTELYINGILIDEYDSYEDAIDADSGGSFLGQLQETFGGGFSSANALDGVLSQVRMYSTAIEQSTVTTLYNELREPPTGMVAHYKLNYFTDTVLLDSSGNGYNGEIPVGATLTQSAGIIGNSMEFDGTTSRVTVDAMTAELSTATTMIGLSFWMKIAALPPDTDQWVIFGLHNVLPLQNFVFKLTYAGDFLVYALNGVIETVTTIALDDSAWHHVVLIMNTDDCHIYVDKMVYNISRTEGLGTTYSTTSPVAATIGCGYASLVAVDELFDGYIDDFRIFVDTELTAGNVNYLYSIGYPDEDLRVNSPLRINLKSVRDGYGSF